jgi:inner membrane protein
MPSPIGHAIGGVAAAWFAAGRPSPTRSWVGQALILGAIAMLPDVDLLFGAHSGPTHSIGAAAIAGLASGLSLSLFARLSRAVEPAVPGGAKSDRQGPDPKLFAVAATAAWCSHILLDWLGEDTSAPFGVMALWPFSREYFMSPIPVMPAITRRYWLPGFWMQNFRALMFELMVLLPIAIAIWIARRRQPRGR